jgi:hypothetical protein
MKWSFFSSECTCRTVTWAIYFNSGGLVSLRDKITILYCYCSTFCVHFDGSWPNLKSLPPTYIRLATNMKLAGVNIYSRPNIWCKDQRRLTTKNFFYLEIELKRNRQFYILSAEEITIRLPAPPMTNGNNYEKTFALKLFGSHTTRIIISIQLQIKYMTNKTRLWNIRLIDFNTHQCNGGLVS